MRWLGVLLSLAACGPVDLQLVTDAGAASCRTNDDCPGDSFCDRAACTDVEGVCTVRPPVCTDADTRPECGCDGVVYWNRCLREASGVSLAKQDLLCPQPRRCSATTPCPDDAWCAFIIHPDQCGMPLEGACFALPDTCEHDDVFEFAACGAPQQCITACPALKSGQQMIWKQGPPGRCH